VSIGCGAHPLGDGEKFDAVADPHLLDQAALDGHDDRDLGQCPLPTLQSDPALSAQRGQRGEGARIAGPGHLGGQVVPRRCEPQQPVHAGPDRVGADQHQQPRAQVRHRLPPADSDRPAPVRVILRAAGPPPLLPAVTGLGSQPVHYG
jgi:hypothetical protein